MSTKKIDAENGSALYVVGDKVTEGGFVRLDMYPKAAQGATAFGNIPLVELLDALSQIPGVTATYEPPVPPLPTEPGVYIGRNSASHPEFAETFKLRSTGWTNGSGGWFALDRIERVNKACGGLVRLVPEDS